MSVTDYIGMLLALTAIASALTLGATRLRARLLPSFTGAPARLAEVVVGLSTVVVTLELLGAVGLLDAPAAIGGCLVAGGAMALLAGPRPPPRARGARRPEAAIVAIAVASLLLFQWAGPTLTSLDRGMTDGDTLWYHMPFAARFVQDGSTTALQFTGTNYLSWFYPANSELLHSFGILLADRHDVLSPILALGWLALALLAAWCVGRPFGCGALCVAAVALLLGSALLVSREAGEARDDLAGLALLLSCVALLLNAERAGRDGLGALAAAGLAGGLAIGTKLTLLAPVGVITVGVILSRARRERVAAGATWLGCLLATGGFWYARNLVHAGNPLPWVKLGIGPVALDRVHQDLGGAPRFSVLHYATDTYVWRHFFFPGLHDAFGALWPLVLALAAAGAVLAVASGTRMQRVIGVAALAAAGAYLVNPLGAPGPEGAPSAFESNLRYLAPALALGLVLLPTTLAAWMRNPWWALPALAAVLLVTDAPLASGGHLSGALVLAAIGIALAAATLLAATRRTTIAAGVAVTACLLVAGLGWPVMHGYVRDRYAGPTGSKLEGTGLDDAYRWAAGVEGARIATTSILQYGLYGDDLSNRVRYLGVEGPRGTFTDAPTCRAWRAALDEGDYRFLVLAPRYDEPGPAVPPEWARSPRARPIMRSGPTTVLRLSGPLPPRRCPA